MVEINREGYFKSQKRLENKIFFMGFMLKPTLWAM